MKGLWRNRDFAKFWTGQTISGFGAYLSDTGFVILALFVFNATPFQMGVLAGIRGVGYWLFGLLSGVWADRVRRRPMMIAADILSAVLLFTVPALYFSKLLNLTVMFAIATLLGIFSVFFETAKHAYLPTLVEKGELTEANSKIAFSESASEIAGNGLAIALVQALTAPIAILLDGFSYLVSAFSLWRIQKQEASPLALSQKAEALKEFGDESESARPNASNDDILTGMRSLFKDPLIRNLTLGMTATHFFGNFIGALYWIYALRTLHIPAFWVGISISVGGVGSLLATFATDKIAKKFPLGRILIASMSIWALLAPCLALLRGPVSVVATLLFLLQFVGDFVITIYFILAISLRQSRIPNRISGRVNSAINLLVNGVAPFGAFVGGWLGGAIGMRPTLMMFVLGPATALLLLLFSPIGSIRSISPTIDDEGHPSSFVE